MVRIHGRDPQSLACVSFQLLQQNFADSKLKLTTMNRYGWLTAISWLSRGWFGVVWRPAKEARSILLTLESVGKSNVGRWCGSGTRFMPRYSWYPHLEPICGYRGHLTHAKYRSVQAAVATHVAPAAPPALVPADLGACTHKFREARRRSTFRSAPCRRQPPPWLPQRRHPHPPRLCLPMPLHPTPSMLPQLPRLCCPPPGLP